MYANRRALTEPAFPLVRIEDIVAEELENISMETVRARLDAGVDDPTLEVAKFCRSVLSNQIKFLDGVGRRCQPGEISGDLIVIHPTKKKVVGLPAVSFDVRAAAPFRRIRAEIQARRVDG